MGLQLKVGGTEADIISEFQVFQLVVWFVMAQSSQLFEKGCRKQDGIAPHSLH